MFFRMISRDWEDQDLLDDYESVPVDIEKRRYRGKPKRWLKSKACEEVEEPTEGDDEAGHQVGIRPMWVWVWVWIRI